jgi:hypothetical protein
MEPRVVSLLLLLFSSVSALTFLSQTNPIEVIDGVPRSAPKRVVRCTQADFGATNEFQILDDSSILHTASVTCNYVTRRYDLNPYGVIARMGRLLRSSLSVSSNSARFLDSNLTDPNAVPSTADTDRDLLWQTITGCGSDISRECQMIQFFTYPGIQIQLKVTQSGSFGRSAPRANFGASGMDPTGGNFAGWGELAAAYCIGQHSEIGPTPEGNVRASPGDAVTPYPSNYHGDGTVDIRDKYGETRRIPCYRTVNSATYDMVEREVNNTLNQYIQYGQSQELVKLQTADLYRNLTKLSSSIDSYMAAANTTYFTLQLRADAERDMAEKTKTAVTRELAQRSDALGNLTARLQATARTMAQSVNQTNSALEQLLLRSAQNKAYATSIQQTILDYAYDNERFVAQQMRSGQKGLSDFAGLLSRAANNEDLVNGQAARIQQGLLNPRIYTAPNGAILQPFTDNIGVPPIQDENDLGELSTVTTVNTSFQTVWRMENNQLFGVISVITQNCSSAFLVGASAPYAPYSQDILTLNGPTNQCTTNYSLGTDPAQRCKCWNVITEKRCQLLGLQFAYDWYLSGDINDGCIADYTTNWNGAMNRVLYTASDLAEAFANMTRRGKPVAGLPHKVTGRSGVVTEADYDPALLDTDAFWNNINGLNINQTRAGNVSLVNIAYSYAQESEISFQTTMANIESMRVRIKGTPPNRMTQEERLFTRYALGDSGPTSIFSMMLYEHYFLNLMIVSLVSIEASVDVSIDGGPVTRITDVILSNTQDNLLQQRSMFAIVVDPQAPASTQYDIPGDAISLSAYAGARETHVDYARSPDAAGFTMDAWRKREGGVEFNHPRADHAAGWYAVAVDTNASSVTYGRCLGPLPVYLGEWCVRREHFWIDISGPFDNENTPGSLVLRDKTSFLDVQVPLPFGDVIITTGSRCPDVQQLAVSGDSLLVLLVNAQGTSNRFRIQQLGACNRTEIVTLAAGGQYTKTAVRCPQAPDDTPDVLAFSYTGPGGAWIPCPNTIQLTYSPQTVSAFQGPAALDGVTTITQNRVDGLLLAIHVAEMAQLAALDAQLISSVSLEVSLGARVDTTVLDFTAQARQVIAELTRLSQEQTAAAKQNFTRYLTDELLAEFQLQMQDIRTWYLAEYAKSQVPLNQMLDDYANSRASYDVLTGVLQKSYDAAAKLVQAFGGLMVGITIALNELVAVTPTILETASDPSVWADAADLLVGDDGVFKAIAGLFITDRLKWIANAFNLSGGSMKGLFVWIVTSVFLIGGIIGVVIAALDIRRFFCQKTGSPADLAATAEILSKISAAE